ncbi:MAG: Ig-like domain-containing protein, partial [Thermoplasmata archaeon]|nr:Ig-like domain-containing protein [Thermoplasmata archaeon]
MILGLLVVASTVVQFGMVADATDTYPPVIAVNTPTGSDVPIDSVIEVWLNETGNFFANALEISPYVAGDVTAMYDMFMLRNGLLYTPSVLLDYETTYTITIKADRVKDSSNNYLDGNGNWVYEGSPIDDFIWTFTTEVRETFPPHVDANSPTGAGAEITSKITVQFNETMNETATTAAFNITPYISGTFEISEGVGFWTMDFYPDQNLELNNPYTVTINGSMAKDIADNTLDGNGNGTADGSPDDDFSWTFTTAATETTPPQVTYNGPTGTGVSVSSLIQFDFDEYINNTSIENALEIDPPTLGTFTFDKVTGVSMVTFTPSSDLEYSTTYNVTINGSIAKDTQDNLLDGNGNGSAEGSPDDDFKWNFTTVPVPVPHVIQNSPTGASVPKWERIGVVFDKIMNHTSIEQAFNITPPTMGTFIINDDTFWGETTLSFYPDSNFQLGSTYDVTINSSIAKSGLGFLLDGNTNGTPEGSPHDDFTWSFTVETTNTTPVSWYTYGPGYGQPAPIYWHIRIVFDGCMDHSTLIGAFNITPYVDGAFSIYDYMGKTYLVLDPTLLLPTSTTFFVTINGSIAEDATGNFFDGNKNGAAEGSPIDNFVWNFTTEDEDTTPPQVSSRIPTGTGVSLDTTYIWATFDEAVNTTVVGDIITVSPSVGGDIRWDTEDGNAVYLENFSLTLSTTYEVRVNASLVMDWTGNTLDGNGNGVAEGSPIDDYVWAFTTEGPDSTPPQVVWSSPNGTNVPVDTNITLLFSELMDTTSLMASLDISLPGPISATFTEVSGKTHMKILTAPLPYDTVVDVCFNGSIAKDLASNT